MKLEYKLKEKLWLYEGKAAWHFITIPPKVTKNIDFYFRMNKGGWGSLPVTVKIGDTIWKTSIFPDSKSKCYLLPIKAIVRKQENLNNGDVVSFSITLNQ